MCAQPEDGRASNHNLDHRTTPHRGCLSSESAVDSTAFPSGAENREQQAERLVRSFTVK